MSGILLIVAILGGLGGLATVAIFVRDTLDRRRTGGAPTLYYAVHIDRWSLRPFAPCIPPEDPDGACITTVQIWNGGKVSISKDMFEHTIEIPVGTSGAKIVACDVVDRISKALPVDLSVAKNRQTVVIAPLLLNPGEGFVIRASILGSPGQFLIERDISVMTRIRALHGPERVRDAQPKEQGASRWGTVVLVGWLLCGYSVLLAPARDGALSNGTVALAGILALVTPTVVIGAIVNFMSNKAVRRVPNPFDVPEYRRPAP